MNDNCQIPNCKKKAKIYRIESKIQHGINLNKVVFHFCDNHKETEIKDFIEDKCSKKSLKKQRNEVADAQKSAFENNIYWNLLKENPAYYSIFIFQLHNEK